jgi:hypothetical protein
VPLCFGPPCRERLLNEAQSFLGLALTKAVLSNLVTDVRCAVMTVADRASVTFESSPVEVFAVVESTLCEPDVAQGVEDSTFPVITS